MGLGFFCEIGIRGIKKISQVKTGIDMHMRVEQDHLGRLFYRNIRRGNAQKLNDLINIVFLGAAALGESDHFPQEPNAGRLDAKDHKKDRQQEHRATANGVAD